MNNELNTMLKSIMEETLEPIKHELKSVNHRLDRMETRMETIEQDVAAIKTDVSTLKRDMNQVMQAALETNGIVKRLENVHRKTDSELNTLSYSVDVLNRDQFYMKTEIEKLKNR